MKEYSFNCLLLTLLALLHSVNALSGEYEQETDKEKVKQNHDAFRKKAVPDYTKIHYAGSMGMFAIGGGWVYGKAHWESDVLFGFIPVSEERPTLFTATVKQNYFPWKISINNALVLEPLSTGLYVCTLLNDPKLWAKSPHRYPRDYYWHSNRFRLNIFIGQRYTWKPGMKNLPTAISFFYELSTCDLYLIKVISGSYLQPKDYLSLSLGVRILFK